MKTLIVVDAQKDFMPGGNLAVPNGDEIVPYINNIKKNYDLVIWTKDWHPQNHCSFLAQGGIWPEHCVQMSQNAALHGNLEVLGEDYVVTKGCNQKFDSYSAFFDDGGTDTGLESLLVSRGITEIDICGLALEYCVKFTVLDALKLGHKVNLLTSGCRGIDNNDVASALTEMKTKGANII